MRARSSLTRRLMGLVVVAALVAGFVPVGQGFATGATAAGAGTPRYVQAAKENAKGVAGSIQTLTAKRVLVRWTPGVQTEQIAAAGGLLGFKVVRTSQKLGWTLVEPTRKGLAPVDLATSLRKTRLAARAEVEKTYTVAVRTGPNDPLYPEQWSLSNYGQTGGASGADISAPEAWAAHGTGSKDIVVAVVDEGSDIYHEDLAGQIWVNTDEIPGNGRDDDKNGYVDDVNGYDFVNRDATVYDAVDGDRHGTHVSGIIGATGNNGKGIAGVNWNVTIMPVKFLGMGGGTDYDGAEAIIYAVDNGADVINCSWGGSYSQVIEEALQYAADKGVLVVAAAGNDGSDVDTGGGSFYPASSEVTAVVTVASTNKDDLLSDFSNYGATSVDLGAPGEDVLSTLPYECTGVFINALPYKVAYLAFAAEAIEPAADRDAAITRSLTKLGAKSTSSILIVDDSMPLLTGEAAGVRLDVYTSALAAAGYTKVNTWSTEEKGTPPISALQGKVVVWFTGGSAAGWYGTVTLDAEDRASIGAYLDNGGRLLLASGEAASEVFFEDTEWFMNYLRVWPVDMSTWGFGLRGEPGTEFEGIGGALPATYQTWWQAPWPTGSDSISPIDSSATPIFGMGGYGLLSGTSMAAPQVSGAAALLMSALPGANSGEIRARLENTVDPLPALDGKTVSGGRLNLASAFETYPGRPTITSPRSGTALRSLSSGILSWAPAAGGSTEATFEAEIGLPEVAWSDDFEDGTLGYSTFGDVAWGITTSAHSGTYAAWSGDLTPGQYAVATTTVDVPAGGATLALWAKMGGEAFMTNGWIGIDGMQIAYLDSPTDWQRFEAEVPAGVHELSLECATSPEATDSSDDALYIDDITVTGHTFTPLGTTAAGVYDLDYTVPAVESPDVWFRVRANLNDVSSAWGYVKNVKITSDAIAPAAPAGFAAVAGSDGDVALSWTDSTDVDFALTRVLRRMDTAPTGPDDAEAVVVYEGTAGAFSDVGLPSGKTAYYGAFSVDENQNWSEGSFDSALVSDSIAPDPVEFLEAVMADGAVTLGWMNPAPWQFSGIKVLRRTDTTPTAVDDPSAVVVYDGTGASVTDFEVMSEPTGTRAYYAVFAYDASANVSGASEVSIIVDTEAPVGTFSFEGLDSYLSPVTGETIAFTTSTAVTVVSDVTGAVDMRFNCEGAWTAREPYASTKSLTLSSADGIRPVIAEYRDSSGNVLECFNNVYYDLNTPDAPVGLAASNLNYSVRLNWDLPEDESVIGWNVYQADSATGPWVQVNDVPADTPEYVAGGLDSGQEYFFAVTAVDGVGHESLKPEAVSSVPNEGVVRRAGSNRYSTALVVSGAHYDTAETVILVSGQGYADAISAAGLAGCYDAPILLTDPMKLSDGVAAEIERLGASSVIIVGGEGAVAETVADSLRIATRVTVSRIAGANRYSTSRAVADAIIAFQGADFCGETFVVSGLNFPDALASAPIAYARKMPILLVRPGSSDSLFSGVGDDTYTRAYMIGGSGALPDADVDWRVDCTWERIAGKDRYETAAAVATYAADAGWASFAYTGVATGTNFADALSGASAIGHEGGVMLLTSPDALSTPAADALLMNAPGITKLDVLGGPGAVSDDVMQEIIAIFKGM
ncbi:MAG: S8 family serine peptidase [Actinomycetota bacterium]|nr:S8 family serine peptidase [Actinomycetota bacterium]